METSLASCNNTMIIDCCGTGGSGKEHFNTSTAIAFVLAAGGLKTAKFGNKAATGKSGSFDFLQALGLPLITKPQHSYEIMAETNLCFLFAPVYYPHLAHLTKVRSKLGKATAFNFVGPLLNPVNPGIKYIGTFCPDIQRAMADYYLLYSKETKAFIVRAFSGLDELDPVSQIACLK